MNNWVLVGIIKYTIAKAKRCAGHKFHLLLCEIVMTDVRLSPGPLKTN